MEQIDIARRALDEHRELKERTDALRKVLDTPRVETCWEWLEQLRAAVADFRAHLVEHMKIEETDGFMTPVLERRPTLRPNVEGLAKEHEKIAADLSEIITCLADERDRLREVYEGCLGRLQEFLTRLSDHEHRETKLVQQVFNLDMGAGD